MFGLKKRVLHMAGARSKGTARLAFLVLITLLQQARLSVLRIEF
jgi:hypothetical protein